MQLTPGQALAGRAVSQAGNRGKMAYLIEEDSKDLTASNDYRGCLGLKLQKPKSSVLLSWMVEKMQKYVERPGQCGSVD